MKLWNKWKFWLRNKISAFFETRNRNWAKDQLSGGAVRQNKLETLVPTQLFCFLRILFILSILISNPLEQDYIHCIASVMRCAFGKIIS